MNILQFNSNVFRKGVMDTYKYRGQHVLYIISPERKKIFFHSNKYGNLTSENIESDTQLPTNFRSIQLMSGDIYLFGGIDDSDNVVGTTFHLTNKRVCRALKCAQMMQPRYNIPLVLLQD